MKNELPSKVFLALQGHLRAGCEHGEEGWEAGNEDEDVLTGDLGSSLRCKWIELQADSRNWKFRFTYKKFRGRGKGAQEKVFGADGIIEVAIEDLDSGKKTGKGLLFQAKKKGDRRNKKLLEQATYMEKIAPHGSAIFEYGPDEYEAYDASTVVDKQVSTDLEDSRMRLGVYLADRFLPCNVGKRGMFYDAVGKFIVYTDEHGDLIRARATVQNRLRVEIISSKNN